MSTPRTLKDSAAQALRDLAAQGRLRRLPGASADPADFPPVRWDFSSNDYLGLGADAGLRRRFLLEALDRPDWGMTSSASRLLVSNPGPYLELEDCLEGLYGRPALLMDSGYHANTGVIPALVGRGDAVVADRLVHASIIDGIRLSGARLERARHADPDHMASLVARLDAQLPAQARILVAAESVYSMDGDRADLRAIQQLGRQRPGRVITYVDEAHAFGVLGPRGLGLCQGLDVDVVVGTLGKAAASQGAFVLTSSPELKELLVNRCRSLIFSTATPPLTAAWSQWAIRHMVAMDDRREHLQRLAAELARVVPGPQEPSHIRPLMAGDASRALLWSRMLRRRGIVSLAIRRPTVPPGTERLRLSLSAAMPVEAVTELGQALKEICAGDC